MNKKLFESVKAKCKDTGLSEKYLKAITEKLGGSIEDNSTDDSVIEAEANRIADVAGDMQAEATRWASKAKEKPTESKTEKDGEGSGNGGSEQPEWFKSWRAEKDQEIEELKKENQNYKAERAKSERAGTIKQLMAKHKIKEDDMKFVTIPDDADPEKFLTDYKQHLITKGLMQADSEGSQSSAAEATEKAADALLESLTAK